MRHDEIEIAVPLWADRHFPVSIAREQAIALQDSGVVDGTLLSDQMSNFLPAQLWRSEIAPLAAMISDPDSFCDVFVLAGYLLSAAPKLSMAISTDSVRRSPAEFIQTMLTIAAMSEGRASFQIGGGELKQARPYGHKRSHGLSRMKDLFEIFDRVLASDGRPFDYEGKRFTFQQASLGGGIPHRPKIYGLGGGPQLLDHTTTHCNGLAATCPNVWATAEEFAEAREQILAQVAAKGRDPDAFEFQLWLPCLLVADEADLEHYLENPAMKWITAILGRINASDWRVKEGLPSPVPEDWQYFSHFLPHGTSDAFIDEVLAKTTAEHLRRGWFCGTPGTVADAVQPFIDAGATWVCPMDYLPLVMAPKEAQQSLPRSIELAGLIRSRQHAMAS